jgi:YegS/Rv2252/BmrU family lipid kinase
MVRRAVAKPTELIIAYGGDGTIHEVVCGMAETKVPLAILPGGTANVLAKELGIPRHLKRAVEAIASGVPQTITLGQGAGHYFHSMAGIGVDASIIKHLSPQLKTTLGIGGFWIEGLKHFYTYGMPLFRIVVDGMAYRASFAVIGNARNYGGNFVITPFASLTEDLFDVCIFTTRSKLKYAMYVPLAFFGGHLRFSDVIYLKAKRVSATSDTAIYVQMDGELVGSLPVELKPVSQALTVIIPRR